MKEDGEEEGGREEEEGEEEEEEELVTLTSRLLESRLFVSRSDGPK